MRFITWTELKAFADDRGISVQWFEGSSHYDITAYDGPHAVSTTILKTDPANSDQTDFETNYKDDGNWPLETRDSDGSNLTRYKITRTGWGLQCHAVEFETCQLNSISSFDKTGTAYGFSDIKFYNAAGTELTDQQDIDTDCVKTVMRWEPNYDEEMIGGEIRQISTPISPVRLNFYHEYSGHEFCTGGLNMQFIGATDGRKMDGRAPKLIPYNAQAHTGRFILVARHAAGLHHKLMLVLELFKE